MWAEDFDPKEALAACPCPRCEALGLLEIDNETYTAAPDRDRHQAAYIISPSIAAKCPACDLVMEYPACRS